MWQCFMTGYPSWRQPWLVMMTSIFIRTLSPGNYKPMLERDSPAPKTKTKELAKHQAGILRVSEESNGNSRHWMQIQIKGTLAKFKTCFLYKPITFINCLENFKFFPAKLTKEYSARTLEMLNKSADNSFLL